MIEKDNEEKDEVDLQIEEFQAHPQFDPMSLTPDLTDEEREKYTTRDGTFNYLAYEKDQGKSNTISPKGEAELNRSFKRWMIIFGAAVAAIVVAFFVTEVIF